jgi:cytidylate kinase
MSRRWIIAMDGPAGVGKSTVGHLVAKRLGYHFINTGEMYRAVTWFVLRHGIDPECQPSQIITLLSNFALLIKSINTAERTEFRVQLYLNDQKVDDQAIRSPEVTAHVSQIAAIPEVRGKLVECQRQSAALGTLVMEGRDIGTVVFPHAKFKFYLFASTEVRAQRRLAQLGEVVEGATLQSVIDEISRRDHLDSTRAVAPLIPAIDARVIDSSMLSIAETVERMIEQIDLSKHNLGSGFHPHSKKA